MILFVKHYIGLNGHKFCMGALLHLIDTLFILIFRKATKVIYDLMAPIDVSILKLIIFLSPL